MKFRFRRLSLVAAIAASLVFTTGFGFGKKKEEKEEGAAAAESAAPAAPPGNTTMTVAVGKEDDLKDFNTLVIPTVYVGFPVEGKVAVSKQGSALQTIGGGSANSVKASASFKVNGLDKALAQQIAKRIQDDLVAQLRATGFTVLSYDEIKDQEYVKDADRFDIVKDGPGLVLAPPGSPDLMWVTPSDDQAFKIGMNGGVYNQFIRLGKPKFKDAVMIIPQFTFTSPHLVGSTGATYSQISAGVDVFPSMLLNTAAAPWMSAKPKVRMGGGNAAGVMLKGPVKVADSVGTLSKEDKTPTAANALSKGLSMLGGGGSISASSANYTMTIDPAVYADMAVKGAQQFNAEIAKAAASVR
ncbi:MAG: hypothetical protein ACOY3X_08455 [Pseudomonadota bacterium]